MKKYFVSLFTQERGFRASPVYPNQGNESLGDSRIQELIARVELGQMPVTDLPDLIGEEEFQKWFDKKYPPALRPKS